MNRFNRVFNRLATVLSFLSVTFNIAQPAILALYFVTPVYAEEIVLDTQSPEPTSEPSTSPSESIAPSPESNIEPSAEPSPSPSPEIIIEPSIEPSLSPEPSIDPSPNPTNQPASPEPTQDSSPAPPSPTADPSPALSPSPIPNPVNLNETLAITILESTDAGSLESFDLTVSESGSATLTTDKPDYAPTDTALISGAGFLVNTTYTLTISSTDDPATSTTVAVITDNDGKLFYAYQLDGIYRPNYRVEAYLASTLVAAITFTDSYVVGSYLCDNDAQGANDEPGQKDLTKMCVNESNLPNSIQANWNWDDTGWSGKNTGDSCALFDTDNDGLANFASCVTVENDPAVQKSTSPRIFTCNDTRADRCAGPTQVAGPYASSCSVTISSDQPFLSGDDSPNDTHASCNIQMSEVGGTGVADLIDVCSFPSDNPNSDPSDCIFAKANSGKLEVIKVLSPTDDIGLFNLQIDSVTKAANVGNNGTTGENVVSAGNHIVAETAGTATTLTNYNSSVACRDLNGTGSIIASNANSGTVSVTIADGSDVICTITNTRINNASLTIIKDANPNDPQDFSFTTNGTGLSSFSLDDDSDATLSNTKVFSSIAAGTYSVSEQAVTGWVQTSAVCSDGSPITAINLSSGENVTCTFTNTKQPTLTVTKVVTNDNGGQLTASSFPLFVDGNSVTSGATNTYTPGTYTISETQQPGYTQTSLTCDSGKVNPVVLNPGDNVACTITNNDIAPQLTVIKNVINDNGGTKTSSDFTMNILGTNVSDSSFPGVESPGTTVTLNAGSYSVDEDGLTGYAKSLSSDCTGTIAVGQTKTCTITNNDIAPTLTLVKTVVNNNGGNLQVSQVPLFISGSPAVSGTAYNVSANTLYTASETQQTGYLASSWGGDCASNGTITLQPGDNKTCTITNDDIAPVLTFIKVVNNNYGGTLGALDFPLYINGNLVTSGVANTLTANTLYTLTESQQYGYTGGTISGNCAADGTITLQPGDDKTCYITNNDVQPRLTVTKVVVNDNGGTKVVTDFPLFVNGQTVTSGVQNLYDAGQYTISETNQVGYTATITGDCASDGSVSLAVGDVKSCTITNDDQPGTLIVNKIVINDNGGNSTADDFSYQIDGATAVPFEADGSNSQVVNSGLYTVTEPAYSGYSTSYNNCTRVFVPNGGSATCTITNDDQQAYITVVKTVINNNGGIAEPNNFNLTLEGSPVLSGVAVPVSPGTYTASETLLPGYNFEGYSGQCDQFGDITVSLGESKTCTLTNNDQQAFITVIKVVTNDDGGSANPNDFNLKLEGNAVLSGIAVPVNPGTYTASETLLSGYTFEGFTGSCDSSGDITVSLGESKTCTLTNNDQQAYVTLVKVVNLDNGGTAQPNDFNLTLEGSSVLSGVAVPVNPGTYTADETLLSGYTFEGFSGDCDSNGDITVSLGQSKTCTLTNSDNAPSLTLIKQVINDNGGTAVPADWTLTAANYDTNSPNAGIYILSESGGPAGYIQTSLTCDNVKGQVNSVTLGLGESVTCTFVNDDIAPTLKLVKNVTINSNGNESPSDWTLTATGIEGFSDSGDSTTFHSVKAGVGYVLSESSIPGYTASDWSCSGGSLVGSTITLGLDDDVTCQITNTDIAPSLTVIKHVSNDDGGNAVVTEFDLELNEQDLTFGVGTTDNQLTSYTATPNVIANTSYTLTELDLPGYNEGSFNCYDNNSKQNVDHPLTLSEGQSVTCEIRNDDIAPQLTLIKNVINDNGGSADPDDFDLTVGATPVLSGVKNTFTANTQLALNETTLSGYSFVSITGSAKCPSILGGTITLDEGDDLTCTITNDDQPGTLTVTKVTLPSDTITTFSITATGSGSIQGSSTRSLSDGTPVTYTLDAGSYDISEMAAAGWDETGNTCSDVTVVNGGSSSCTITNTKRGHLIVQKTTIPAEDSNVFAISATGSGTITGGGAGSISDNTDHDYEVTPGTYSVSETVPGNWDQTSNTCTDIIVGAGETKYCEITNTKRGDVTVIKYHDHNGNGAQDDGDETLDDWEIKLDQMNQWTGAQVDGQVTFSDLVTGDYTLSESLQDGWMQTNISCTSDESVALDNDNNHPVTVNPGETTTCKIGNFKLGRIYGYKYEDTNGSGTWDEGEDPLSDWTIYLGTTSATTNDDGYFEFDDLTVGNYQLTENETNLDYARTQPESGSYDINIESGTGYNDEDNYLFGNAPLTDIHGYKWDDVNGNGRRDCDILSEFRLLDQLDGCEYIEELMGDWTIFIDLNDNQVLDDGEQSTTTDNDPESDHYGWYWFYDLFPGEYTICEQQKSSWIQTYPISDSESSCHTITLPNDNEQTENGVVGPEYHFGNQAEPELLIKKSNDASGNKNPGDLVTYTLTLDLTGSSLSGVILTDITPEGFVYVPGSYTATLNGNPLIITEPNYASPGTWGVGDMQGGDQIVLTYQAKIDLNQDGGTYNDIAWAEGSSKGWGTILALGHDSEYVDEIFVGTDVVINKNQQATGSVDVERTGEVLGASTELPATGANNLWIILALSSIISGLALIFGGKYTKRAIVTTLLLIGTSLIPSPTYAADPENNLSVRVEQPQSPTRVQDFKLSFSVLDRMARTPEISCYVKKPGEGSFVQFDSTKVSSKTTGDNGYCQINSSVLGTQGTYQFYVTAASGGDSENSATVSVSYDTDGPGRPTWYSREHPSICRWVIKFRTADDGGLTQKVEIYSSSSTSFNTDSGTRVGTLNIGSNQEGSYNHDRADSCDKEYYYVIRAFDAAGNQSDYLGDEIVTVTSSSSSSVSTPAIAIAQGTGSVLGSNLDDSSSNETTQDTGLVMDENIETIDIEAQKEYERAATIKKWWYVAGGLLALIILLYVYRKIRRT